MKKNSINWIEAEINKLIGINTILSVFKSVGSMDKIELEPNF